jgi:hypothetical protein
LKKATKALEDATDGQNNQNDKEEGVDVDVNYKYKNPESDDEKYNADPRYTANTYYSQCPKKGRWDKYYHPEYHVPIFAVHSGECIKLRDDDGSFVYMEQGGRLEYGDPTKMVRVSNLTDLDIAVWIPSRPASVPPGETVECKSVKFSGNLGKLNGTFYAISGSGLVMEGQTTKITSTLTFFQGEHYVYRYSKENGKPELVMLEEKYWDTTGETLNDAEGITLFRERDLMATMDTVAVDGYTSLSKIFAEMISHKEYDIYQKGTWVKRTYPNEKVYAEREIYSYSSYGKEAKIVVDKTFTAIVATRNLIDELDVDFKKGAKVKFFGILTGGPSRAYVDTNEKILRVALERYEYVE